MMKEIWLWNTETRDTTGIGDVWCSVHIHSGQSGANRHRPQTRGDSIFSGSRH